MRNSRKTVIDPVLSLYPPLSSDEEDEPPDPEEVRKILEREKIRDLKKRRIDGGAGYSSLGLRKSQTQEGVHIRLDQKDESAEVEIWDSCQGTTTCDLVRKTETPVSAATSEPHASMEVDTPPTSLVASPDSLQSLPPTSETLRNPTSGRTRKLTRKAAEYTRPEKHAKKTKDKGKPENISSAIPDEEPHDLPASESNLDKRGKPRPETYKQAWSVSEQHLLERLLEEIPDGEKNRFEIYCEWWRLMLIILPTRQIRRQVGKDIQGDEWQTDTETGCESCAEIF